LVVKTRKNAALAAAHRIDPGRWWDGFGALLDRIGVGVATERFWVFS